MPKFLFVASYTLEGTKGVQNAGGSSRRSDRSRVATSLHGRRFAPRAARLVLRT